MKLSPATGVVLLATVGLLVLAFDLRHERDLLVTELEAEREALHRLVSTLVTGETDKINQSMAKNQAELIREILAGRSVRSTPTPQSVALTGGLDKIVARLEGLHSKLQGQAAAPAAAAAACTEHACQCPSCTFKDHSFEIGGVGFDTRKGRRRDSPARLASLMLPTYKLDPMPIVGGDYHPWRQENLRNGDYKPTYLLSTDPEVETGNISGCKKIDVHFIQTGYVTEKGTCSLLIPDRTIKTRLFEVPMDYQTGSPMPLTKDAMSVSYHDKSRLFGAKRDGRLQAFFGGREVMATHAGATLAKAGIGNTSASPILVMVANEGHTPLLLNWACSIKLKGISMPDHLIFVTHKSLHDRLVKLGFTVFHHASLGDFPTKPAAKYADGDFGEMMFMKMFSVSIALETGHDVLFQDLDVTWLSNPMAELQAKRDNYHGQFQDDNSRQERFAPYFANTGFFYLTSVPKTRWFWEQVLTGLPNYPQGNQYVLATELEHFTRRWEFKPRTLPLEVYQSGAYLSHPTKTPARIKFKPIFPEAKVLHFCWTEDLEEKREKMEFYKQLFVPSPCLMSLDACFKDVGETPEWSTALCANPEGTPPPGS